MTDSRMTVPMIQPMMARVASFSDLAEKNFWYMDWLPSMSRQVGRKSSSADWTTASSRRASYRVWMKGEVAEELEVGGGEGGANGGPAAGEVHEYGQRDEQGEGGEQADDDVHVGDRGHAGDRGEERDEGGEDAAALDGGDGREDEVQDVSAADELIAGDGGVGEEDGDDAEDAGGLVVAGFEQVGDGELRELAGAWSDEVDERESSPSAGGLPEGGEAVAVGVLCAAEQRAGADPELSRVKTRTKAGSERPATR